MKKYLSTLHYGDEGVSDLPEVRSGRGVEIIDDATLDDLNRLTDQVIALVDRRHLVLGVIRTPYLDVDGVCVITEPIVVRLRKEIPERNYPSDQSSFEQW